MKDPDPFVDRYVLVFHESLRGLVPGAPVDFRGITIGEVVSINTRIDMVNRTIELPVEVKLFPDRLVNRQRAQSGTSKFKRDPRKNMTLLAERGMRAQVRTGNLLTGQLYIAMDFFPRAPKAQIKWDADPPELPTIPGELQDLKTSLESVVQKLNKVDFEGISTDVKDTLKSTTKMIKQLDTTIAELSPELKAMVADARDALISADRALKSADTALGPDSPVLQDSRATMQEFSRAAQSFRNLADYLEQHPEALISGKKADDKDNGVKQESKEGEKK
jgi:paraquat-inducible protein B